MRPTKAIVHLGAIAQNLEIAQRFAPDSKIMAIIKANAYGHGAVEVARALQASVPAFAVAFFEEAVQLREAGITLPILVLQGTTSDADVAEAAANDFWLMLHSRQQVDRVLRAPTTRPVRVWVKADTGMHRLGLAITELDAVCELLSTSSNVHPQIVLCTHLAVADEPENSMTRQQTDLLLQYAVNKNMPLSMANSAAIMYWPETHAAWNRPGYMLYGNCPLGSFNTDIHGLVPAMTMTSRLIAIKALEPGDRVGYGLNWVAEKHKKIGVISIGYADGYPRHAAHGTPVLINSRRVPLIGRVSMSMISVDLTALEGVEVGATAELWGPGLSVNEVASFADTIGYEILAGLSGSVPLTHVP